MKGRIKKNLQFYYFSTFTGTSHLTGRGQMWRWREGVVTSFARKAHSRSSYIVPLGGDIFLIAYGYGMHSMKQTKRLNNWIVTCLSFV